MFVQAIASLHSILTRCARLRLLPALFINLFMFAALLAPPAYAANQLFGPASGGAPGFYSLDPDTAKTTLINAQSGGYLFGAAIDPATSTMYLVDSTNKLLAINTGTGAVKTVATLTVNLRNFIFDDKNNTLFGLASQGSVRINPSTGAATIVSSTAVPGLSFNPGIALDSANRLLYTVDASKKLISVNVDTGAIKTIATLSVQLQQFTYDSVNKALFGTTSTGFARVAVSNGAVTNFTATHGSLIATATAYDATAKLLYVIQVNSGTTTTYSLLAANSGTGAVKTVGTVNPPLSSFVFGPLAELSEKNLGECGLTKCVQKGNPVNAAVGNKYQVESDYTAAAITQLEFTRYYNSLGKYLGGFGNKWSHSYNSSLVVKSGSEVRIMHANGRIDTFRSASGVWKSDPDVTDKLTRIPATGTQTGWQLVRSDDSVWNYLVDGRLNTITTRAGLKTTLAYDTSKRLSTVTAPFGHKLTFTYNTAGRITKVTLPDAGALTYAYDAKNNPVSVTYPDGKVRKYVYENTAFPNALTGIVDEKGTRFATYAYDAKGRATSTTHAGNAGKYSFNYVADGKTTEVTDARGNKYTYALTTQFDLVKPTGLSGAPVPDIGGKARSYDANGFVASITDFNNNKITYVNDARGLETSRVEASGNALARTTTTTWHATFRLPLTVTEPGGRKTTYAYDAKGNVLKKTVASGSLTRVWAYTYNANGQVLTVDGPRTDVSDITKFTYDAKGNLASVTNAAGKVTSFTSYDANGRLLSMTDPNGLITKFTYDKRGRTLTRTEGTEVTTYAYDAAGLLTSVKLPDAATLTYAYDSAQRPVKITDNLGNYIATTLDAYGNVTAEKTYDPAAALKRSIAYAYDSANRLTSITGAASQVTSIAYDTNSNILSVTDPLAKKTTYTYDALNRVLTATDPLARKTSYAYDALDNLTKVTDPRALATSYAYDGLDNQTKLTSPDTGAASKTYDAAGNVTSITDARAKKTTYTYDALNRLTKVTFADATTIVYAYDATGGVGQLTSMTDPTGSTVWSYDKNGRVIKKVQKVGTLTFTTSLTYATNGRLTGITYPSGKKLAYTYDALGRVTAITVNGVNLISKITWAPFGGPTGWLMANGKSYARSYDSDGRVASFTTGTPGKATLTYDAASRVTKIAGGTALGTRSFVYDAAGQITSASYPNGSSTATATYTYDANGNRTKYTDAASGTTFTYTVAANSNRISTVKKPATVSLVYDAAGNLTGDGTTTYAYDARGRMASAKVGSITTSYGINGLEQRVSKKGSGVATGTANYVYDEDGQLIGEYDATGKLVNETVYLGSLPVGILTASATYTISPDHLGAPRAAHDAAGKDVWSWERLPYGNTLPIASGLTYNLRFPGQYYDAETKLHYNHHRDYDPALTGRYIQSDPIGLQGGINTYAYALNSPTNLTDPKGLFVQAIPLAIGACLADPVCAVPVIAGTGLAINQLIAPKLPNNHVVHNENAEDTAGGMCPDITPRPDLPPLHGGRSGGKVKNLKGPPNSAIPGAPGRIYITDKDGNVVVDVDGDRAKDILPGVGQIGGKRPPTQTELDLLDKVGRK